MNRAAESAVNVSVDLRRESGLRGVVSYQLQGCVTKTGFPPNFALVGARSCMARNLEKLRGLRIGLGFLLGPNKTV